ncbi:hypothetical protein IL54_2209 [Sphingobium sp. ba1]|nr:hypothetical protein IL54_2209 [Sphingobium sp. ba1]
MQQDVSFRAAQGADDRRVGQVADERGIGGRAGEGPIRQEWRWRSWRTTAWPTNPAAPVMAIRITVAGLARTCRRSG